MIETLTGFAALAVLGLGAVFVLLMLFMGLVQPIWSLIDCAIDPRRGSGSKIVWVLALVLLWGLANWFYGAFAAANGTLRGLTRLAWALLIALAILFVLLFQQNDDFRRGIQKEWRDLGGGQIVLARPAPFGART